MYNIARRCRRYKIDELSSYDDLVRHYPEIDAYKLYHAQALYKSGQYAAAQKACLGIENSELSTSVSADFLQPVHNHQYKGS